MPDASRNVSEESKAEEIVALVQFYEKRNDKLRGMGNGAVFNGSTKMISWLLGINAVLIAGAIMGGIGFAMTSSGRLSSLEAKMEMVMVRLK
jgi:hypothetical protein